MADFILILVAALTVAGLGFGLVSFAVGREPGLPEPKPDGVGGHLPPDRPVVAADLVQARFDVALRGYRMDQVDQLIAAAAAALWQQQDRVAALEHEIAQLRGVADGDRA